MLLVIIVFKLELVHGDMLRGNTLRVIKSLKCSRNLDLTRPAG